MWRNGQESNLQGTRSALSRVQAGGRRQLACRSMMRLRMSCWATSWRHGDHHHARQEDCQEDRQEDHEEDCEENRQEVVRLAEGGGFEPPDAVTRVVRFPSGCRRRSARPSRCWRKEQESDLQGALRRSTAFEAAAVACRLALPEEFPAFALAGAARSDAWLPPRIPACGLIAGRRSATAASRRKVGGARRT